MKYLPNIKGPADLLELSEEELIALAEEIRQDIISSVSTTGGHLATNLGSVELTIALHHVYDIAKDKLIWDVSNQTYVHKILTGRRDRMDTIRQYKGLAGFAKREESLYDHFGAGHASTSISAALGFAAARDQQKEDHHVIAVIGDGAMSGGLAFEGLNNAGHLKSDLLVILNDNSWSISKNVGALSKYLTNITTDEKFNKLRTEIWELTGKFKRRDKIRETISQLEASVKSLLVPGMVFQKLGFRYFGPIDGNDLPLMIKTLNNIKNLSGPVMLHIGTVKGKGYKPAEGNPTKYHGVGPFDKLTGEMESKPAGRPSYTKVFGDTMLELAAKDEKVVTISAAMAPGTGLADFASQYPERFYDVGIAEGHAGTFAAGLAAGGIKPYLTIYSTFMQRAFDMVIHDMALQKLPVVICMDRAGLVGADGPTHHGTFDLTFMSTIHNIVIAVPKDGNELRSMLHYTADNKIDGPVGIRYPRETVPADMTDQVEPIEWGTWEWLTDQEDIVLVAVGTMVDKAKKIKDILSQKNIKVSIVNARFVKPMDEAMLATIRSNANFIVTLEENVIRGGFGQAVAEYLYQNDYQGKFRAIGLPDKFVTHGTRNELFAELSLDDQSIADKISADCQSKGKSTLRFLNRLKLRTANSDVDEVSNKDDDSVSVEKGR